MKVVKFTLDNLYFYSYREADEAGVGDQVAFCGSCVVDVHWDSPSQLVFYVNLHRAVIGPSATLTGR